MRDGWSQFSESQLQRIYHRKHPYTEAKIIIAMTRDELIRGIQDQVSSVENQRLRQYDSGF